MKQQSATLVPIVPFPSFLSMWLKATEQMMNPFEHSIRRVEDVTRAVLRKRAEAGTHQKE